MSASGTMKTPLWRVSTHPDYVWSDTMCFTWVPMIIYNSSTLISSLPLTHKSVASPSLIFSRFPWMSDRLSLLCIAPRLKGRERDMLHLMPHSSHSRTIRDHSLPHLCLTPRPLMNNHEGIPQPRLRKSPYTGRGISGALAIRSDASCYLRRS